MLTQGQVLLEKRGIYKEAMNLDWDSEPNGWIYPVVHSDGSPYLLGVESVMRFKAYDSAAKQKYLWVPSKPADLKIPYYLSNDTVDAIKRTELVYIASGEPDHLVFRSVGAKNVLNFFGEGSIPDDMVDDDNGLLIPRLLRDLRTMGAKKVYTYPDLDNQGRGFAKRLHALLAGTEIDYRAYKLPGESNSKYDINKVWMDVQFSEDAFWEKLALCDAMEFDPIVSQAALPTGDEKKELPLDYLRAIESRLRVSTYNDKDNSDPISCPFGNHEHDNTTPAANWNRVKHMLVCHKCRASGVGGRKGPGEWLAVEVGERLNLDLRDFLPQGRVGAQGQSSITQNNEIKILPAVDTRAITRTEVLMTSTGATEAGHTHFGGWSDDEKTIRGLKTGFPDIDLATGGFEANDLVVLLARTGNGKSSLAMQMSIDFQEQGGCLIFPTEMTPEWYIHRLVSYFLGINMRELYTGHYANISPEHLKRANDAYMRCKTLNLSFWPGDNPTGESIVSACEAFKLKGGRSVIVDSIQNIERGPRDLFSGTEHVMKKLRYVARDVGLTVLATCQANRGPADRANKEPFISDAQGGGTIEQNATRMLTLYRPGYDIETHQVKDDGMTDHSAAYLSLAKDRNFGSQGTTQLLKWEAGPGFKVGTKHNIDFSGV